MYKKIIGGVVVVSMAIMAVACSNKSDSTKTTEAVTEAVTKAEQEVTTEAEQELKSMSEQGNPLEVNLSEIAEKAEIHIKHGLRFPQCMTRNCQCITATQYLRELQE